jgi:acetamidase/formamidase
MASLIAERGLAPRLRPAAPRVIHQPDAYRHTFGPDIPAIARIAPGETVIIHTEDCFGGRLTGEDQLPTAILDEQLLNPLTGPFWIEGAEPGDTLLVHIDDIQPARDWGISCLLPGCGALTSTPEAPSLHPPLPERVWRYRRTDRGSFVWGTRWEVPWAPFFGTIGVAPAGETRSCLTLGPHGGNLDVPEVGSGRTLFLPVQAPGALFAVGDAHAAQGQGELGGPALEIAAYGTFRFGLIRGKSISWPRIESPEAIMAIGIGRPMEDAARCAYHELITWMVTDYGFEQLEAYQLLTLVGGLQVGSMVNASHALVASCPKHYLPAGGGVGRIKAELDSAGAPTAPHPTPASFARRPPPPPGERPWHLT